MNRHAVLHSIFALALLLPAAFAGAQSLTSIQYLGNEGVMLTHQETKVLFDPLFSESFGQYQLVPGRIRTAIFAGEAPYDGVDAVFVSHYHDDHFSPEDMLRLLRSNKETRLYAPAQAVAAMHAVATSDDAAVFARVTGLDLEYGDRPVRIQANGLSIDAVHVPHTGWPTRSTDVQNLAFRVTLDRESTVLHLGDADPKTVHFASDEQYWEERQIDLALPPYWFFASPDGIEILESRLDIVYSIGIHVPDAFADPANIPAALRNAELFTEPGEGRRF